VDVLAIDADAVGLVIRPVKIVPDMTYNVWWDVKPCSINQSIIINTVIAAIM